jgi:hypothetical protein
MGLRTLTAAAFLAFAGLWALPASGETLLAEQRVTLTLSDGTDLVLYGADTPSRDGKMTYYYLPANLSISENAEGRPEFLFMQFISDEAESAGGVSGALLHFLVEWGLTPAQETELKAKLQSEHDGVLGGAATVFPPNAEGPSFYIVSATVGDESLGGKLVTSGQSALVPGGKAATAVRLDKYGAQLLAETFNEDSTITDVTAVMNMEYAVKVKGVEGSVTIDWSKIESESETITANYSRTLDPGARSEVNCFIVWCNESRVADYVYSYDEVRSQFAYLEENEYVDFQFAQGDIPEEIAAPIRDAFIQYFISSVTEPEPAPAPNRTEDEGEEGEGEINIREGAGYTFNQSKVSTSVQRGTQRLALDMDLTVRYPFQLIGNMKSWYGAAASDPYAVQQVILNDPYFQRREILFLLDGDVKDMFDEHINMVSVEVEKNRPEGKFTDSITFTDDTLADAGKLGRIAYARGTGANTGAFDYKVKWNFRGGGELLQPATGWSKGSWEGVTLSAPISARTIEFEGDQREMEQLGITRIVAQVRYPFLGEEKEENIQLSARGNTPIVEQKIFIDREAEGYVYRLVVYHKTLGRMAFPWSKRVSDDYIYASLPGELVGDLANDVVTAVIETAQDAFEGDSGDQLRKFDILRGN